MTLASNTYFYYLCLSIEGGNSLQTIVVSSVPIYNAVGAKIFHPLIIRISNLNYRERLVIEIGQLVYSTMRQNN